MSSLSTSSGPRPLSIAELADKGSEVPFDPRHPVRRYLTGADTLRKQAQIYEDEGDLQSAFVQLCKAAKLLIDILPYRHPEYRTLPPQVKKKVKKDSEDIITALSTLKPTLNTRYETWLAQHPPGSASSETHRPAGPRGKLESGTGPRRRLSVRSSSQDGGGGPRSSIEYVPSQDEDAIFSGWDVRNVFGGIGEKKGGSRSRAGSDPRRYIPYTPPPPNDLADLAFSSSKTGRLSPAPSSMSAGSPVSSATVTLQSARRTPSGLAPTTPSSPSTSSVTYASSAFEYPTLAPAISRHMSLHQTRQGFAPRSSPSAAYYQIGQGNQEQAAAPQKTTRDYITPRDLAYGGIPSPAVSSASPSKPRPLASSPYARPGIPLAFFPRPSPATIDYRPIPSLRPPEGPPRPPKEALEDEPEKIAIATDSRQDPEGAQKVGRDAEALVGGPWTQGRDEPITAYTESGSPLRTVTIPSHLISQFVSIAHGNTVKKLETCALLMGNLKRNAFTVTHLLVPKQTATSDTCTTEREEEVFEFQDQRDLLTLGWIHTHPTQSCFMSSLDLHTHASYQLILPEAIAIVCAPNQDPSFGLFRLTDPPGLQTIAKCDEAGLFHPHPDLPIYTDAIHGHVHLVHGAPLEVADLRGK